MDITFMINPNSGSPKFWAKQNDGDVIYGSVRFAPNTFPTFFNVKRESSSSTVSKKRGRGYNVAVNISTVAALDELIGGKANTTEAMQLYAGIAQWVRSNLSIQIKPSASIPGAPLPVQSAAPAAQPAPKKKSVWTMPKDKGSEWNW